MGNTWRKGCLNGKGQSEISTQINETKHMWWENNQPNVDFDFGLYGEELKQ